MNQQSPKPQQQPERRVPTQFPGRPPERPDESLVRPWIQRFLRMTTRSKLIVVSVALLLVLVVVAFLSRVDSVAVSKTAPLIAAPDDVGLRAQQEALALKGTRREEVRLFGEATLSRADELATEIERWKEIERLSSNEDGKFLANHPDFVISSQAILAARRATQADLDRYRQALHTLLGPARSAGESSEYVPKDSIKQEFARYAKELESAVDTYRKHRTAIESLVAAARKGGGPSPHTLAEAVAEEGQRVAAETAETTAAIVREAERDTTLVIAKAHADQVRALGEQKAADIGAETRRLEEEAAAKREEAQRKAEHERLLARAKDQAVQTKYAPFLTPSQHTLAGGRHATDTPKPVSYNDMIKMGAMHDHISFAKTGAAQILGQGRSATNPGRPHWPCPTTDEAFAAYKERYDEFKLLAPYWIKLELLQP